MKLRKLTSRAAFAALAASALFASQGAVADSMDASCCDDIMRMQQQLLDMQRQLDEMGNASGLEERLAALESEPKRLDTMIFFRGGYARTDFNRNGDLLTTAQGLLGSNQDRDGWYMGAGLEHQMTDGLWGMWDGADIWGEIAFDYKQIGQTAFNGNGQAFGSTLSAVGNGVPVAAANGLAIGPLNAVSSVHVTQLTLSASPKVKFMPGSKFRPWIIPVGMEISIISPPSDGVTVLQAGPVFGAGAEYNVWKNFVIGADARYHLSLTGTGDGNRSTGLTAGGYLGWTF